MGTPINPNYNCPKPEKRSFLWEWSLGTCLLNCTIENFCPDELIRDCIDMAGDCFYKPFWTYCQTPIPGFYNCWCFMTFSYDTCVGPAADETDHEGDTPCTLLFDYGMCWTPGTKHEVYPIEDTKRSVIAFRNPKVPMNVKIKNNTALWLNYDVDGVLTPDATGNYTSESESPFDPLNKLPESDKKPSFVGPDREFFLWWDGVDTWFLSDSVGCLDNPYWSRVGALTKGVYNPHNGAIGQAGVTMAGI